MSYAKKALVGASALLMGTSALPALSHTNAIGYVGDGTGGVTFWYGTYHVGTQFNEAELKLEGANGTSYTTTINQFNLLEQTLPAGLDPNTNYFTTDGTQLVPWMLVSLLLVVLILGKVLMSSVFLLVTIPSLIFLWVMPSLMIQLELQQWSGLQ